MGDVKKFQALIGRVEKEFGKEAISGTIEEVKRVSSGCISFDNALGGGWAVGRILEVFGWEGSGKTSMALHLAAEVQKMGGRVAYIDTEHSLDLFYASSLGVDVDIEAEDPKFVLSQPDNGEQAMEMAYMFADSGLFQLIVMDSVSALLPKAVIQGKAGDAKIGLIARLLSQNVPKLIGPAKKNNCTIMFINQFREKIGVMFGSPTTTSGGNALKFYTSQRVEIARIGNLKDKEDKVFGIQAKVKVKKNKVSPPFREAQFQIIFGEGFGYMQDVLEISTALEIVKKAGSWFAYGETKLGQGFDNVIVLLKDNPELFEEIELKVKEECGIPV